MNILIFNYSKLWVTQQLLWEKESRTITLFVLIIQRKVEILITGLPPIRISDCQKIPQF